MHATKLFTAVQYSCRQDSGTACTARYGMLIRAHSENMEVGARGVARVACQRGISATGHIDFLEFINASALSFARKPCNMLGSPASIVAITRWIGSMRVPGTTQPTLPIHPASSTSPRAGKASLRSEPSKRAIEAGRAGGTPASTTRAGHLACAWLARAHAQPRLDYRRIKRT